MNLKCLRANGPGITWRGWLAISAIAISTFGATSLGAEPDSQTVLQEDPSRAEYIKAKDLAIQGKTDGYRRLIKMATNDQSAEWSEGANERIWRLLHQDARRWLCAMAPIDDPSLRKFLAWSVRIWPMLEQMPEEHSGIPTFRRDVLVSLKAFKGTSREQALAKFMIDLFSALTDEAEAKPETP